jgi:hypothetical protein
MRKRMLLTIAILALSFIGAYWLGSRTKGPQQPAMQVIEGLAVNIADLKAGEVWEEKQYIHRLPIHNTTNTDIEILSFIKSCSCTEVEPRSLTIPAGQTATVNLIIDLTHRTMAELDLAARPFAIEVKPYLKSVWPRTPGWSVEGTVKSRVTLDTKAVHFGERPVYGQPPVKMKCWPLFTSLGRNWKPPWTTRWVQSKSTAARTIRRNTMSSLPRNHPCHREISRQTCNWMS